MVWFSVCALRSSLLYFPLGDRSGLQSDHVQSVLWQCVAEIIKVFPEKDVIWVAAYVAPNGAFTDVQVTRPVCTKEC